MDSENGRRLFSRWTWIGIALIVVVAAGLALYYQSYIRASLLVDQPYWGPMWSTLVRHSTTYDGETIYCYDEGSRFCENILTRVTGNENLQFERQRTLGYLFSSRLDLPNVDHKTL